MAGEPGSEVYPVVFSTYRLTEMYTSGAMSRRLPYLAELQPDLFVEVDPVLAQKRGLENGGWATIISPRGVIEARVQIGRASCRERGSRAVGGARLRGEEEGAEGCRAR